MKSCKDVLKNSKTLHGALSQLKEWFPDKSVSIDIDAWDFSVGKRTIEYRAWVKMDNRHQICVHGESLYDILMKVYHHHS